MKYKLEIRSIWEYGQRKDDAGRPHQEDSLFPHHGEFKPSDRVFILCDGMGGHAAGEVASATVCDAMSQSILPLAAKEPFVFTDEDMKTAVTAAFDALDALDDGGSGKGKMGTTMTALVLHNGGATIAHMGDSRVYHIRPGKQREDTRILFQTRDHSLVNDLVAVGEITAEEAKTHPQRNVITRALQPHTDRRPRPDIAKTIVDIKAGDYFYLCSDGMLEIMDNDAIRFNFSDTTGDIDQKVQLLTTATCQNRDNHTAILVHVLEVEDPLPIVEPEEPAAPKATAAGPAAAANPFEVFDTPSTETPGDVTDADEPPHHSRRPLIIATVVLVALLIGGAILLLKNNKKDNSNSSTNRPSTSTTTTNKPSQNRGTTVNTPATTEDSTGNDSIPSSDEPAVTPNNPSAEPANNTATRNSKTNKPAQDKAPKTDVSSQPEKSAAPPESKNEKGDIIINTLSNGKGTIDVNDPQGIGQ
ncbi:MAG: protein phosphatase 2C domain-containing protein [Bacteroidales bacterium]|nr:protein phosphatase 2C domain-containing protein [Bacteroidales bacterium]